MNASTKNQKRIGKRRIFSSPAVLSIFLILVITGTVMVYEKRLSRTRAALPALMTGEKLPDLPLADEAGRYYSTGDIRETGLVFIFQRPCSPCNTNYNLWRQMARILNKRSPGVQIRGIVLNGPEGLQQFNDGGSRGFPVCAPLEPEAFIRRFRVRLNLAQTLLVHRGRVHRLRIGELEGEDYRAFLREVIRLSKESGEKEVHP